MPAVGHRSSLRILIAWRSHAAFCDILSFRIKELIHTHEGWSFHGAARELLTRQGSGKIKELEHLHSRTRHRQLSRRPALQIVDAKRSARAERVQAETGRQRVQHQRPELPR